jgi:ABC-type Fe3+/spermidine/putrescine transport system ATPase subunit
VIEVRGLTKRYGRVLAVDGLSFDVRPGVVTGFLGPNGSGKSTTMRLMLGLDAPDRGAVRIAGRAGKFSLGMAQGWASRRRRRETRACCCSTSRSTAWTPRAAPTSASRPASS